MKPWTPRHLRRAHRLREKGCPLDDIGRRLGRSERAVACKLSLFAPDGSRLDGGRRLATPDLVTELERRGYTCTPPEHGPAQVTL